jgi:hypothetical protein
MHPIAFPCWEDGTAIVVVNAATARLIRRLRAPGMDLYPFDWTDR